MVLIKLQRFRIFITPNSESFPPSKCPFTSNFIQLELSISQITFNPETMKGYLNLKQTCEALGVKRTTLYKIIHQGAFNGKGETIMHCNKRWFSENAVDNYIQKVVDSNSITMNRDEHKH